MSFLSGLTNIFKRRDTLVKEKSHVIKLTFAKVNSLLKNNVLDFSIIKLLITNIQSEISQEDNIEEQRLILVVVRKYLKYLFTDIYEKLKNNDEKNLTDYYYFVNCVNFFMILLINYPDSTSFIEVIIEPNCNFIVVFFKCLQLSLSYKEQYDIIKILMNFYTSQFLTLFVDSGLIEYYNSLKEKLLKITMNNFNYKRFPPLEYKILIKHLLVLEFDFKNILENSKICKKEDKPLCKLYFFIIQSNIFALSGLIKSYTIQ